MFKDPTVFVLGAGASWHYGLPTGEELVSEVSTRANILLRTLTAMRRESPGIIPEIIRPAEPVTGYTSKEILRPWDEGISKVSTFYNRLSDAHPLVIDYWLGRNPDLQVLGRFFIAWVIIQHQRMITTRSKWIRFVVARLLQDCKFPDDLLENKVTFVTFNYDTSLESNIYKALSGHSFFDGSIIKKFMDNDRFVHVYGKVDAPENLDLEKISDLGKLTLSLETLNKVFYASRDLRVIDPDDKASNIRDIDVSIKCIRDARVVYILGYGFDEANNSLLKLKSSLFNLKNSGPKAILFTNYKDSNRINKIVSKLFFGKYLNFNSGSTQIVGRLSHRYYEKSTRDVCEALALDFDWLDFTRPARGSGRVLANKRKE